jgi:hypothetical protein
MNTATVTDLTADECWQLLHRHDVARLFYRVGGQPHVAVVSHAVIAGSLFFRTVQGSEVLSSIAGREVSIELDEHQELGSRCVVLRGLALRSDESAGDARPGDEPSWGCDLVEVVPISISGRRLQDAALSAASSF